MLTIMVFECDPVYVDIYKRVFENENVLIGSGLDALDNLIKAPDIIIYDRDSLGGVTYLLIKRFEGNQVFVVECSHYESAVENLSDLPKPDAQFLKPLVPGAFYQRLLKQYDDFNSSGEAIRTLVVIDDDEYQLERLRRIFIEDYEVHCFKSALEAFHFIKTCSDEMLIILDILMENMNGFEFLKVLREEVNQRTPVLCLSARKMNKYVDRAMALGANEYMFKPYNVQKIKNRVSVLCLRGA